MKSTFLNPFKSNFDTLLRAAKASSLCLLECQDKKTGNRVATICALNFDGKEYGFVPLARMIDGNPYEQLNPPIPELLDNRLKIRKV